MKKKRHVFQKILGRWIWFGVLVLCMAVCSFYYAGIVFIEPKLAELNTLQNTTLSGQAIVERLLFDLTQTMGIVLPVICIVLMMLGMMFRLMVGRSFERHVKPTLPASQKGATQKGKSVKVTEKIVYRVDKNREKLLYFNLLSAFQREGQWVDFLNEDLELYEDDQIGAAVRNIHQNCKKVLDSHFSLLPVLKQDQGEEITLESGFSPDMIKLVGNVQGKPPFSGVIRHKGWKIQKMDIPDFSGEQNLDILAPAEVEIL